VTRVALLGYGGAGRILHRPLIERAGLSITRVVTRDPGRASQASSEVPGARVVPAAEQLWAEPEAYDVVVVATGGPTHVPLAEAALALGKTVVVDKPLADSLAGVERLVSLGGRLTVFQNRRWDSDTLTASSVLGSLGDLVRLESRFTRFRPQVPDRWREDPAVGGGVLLDLGSHVVDQALHLLGPAVSVFAEVDVRRVSGRAEDDVFLGLVHASGVRSHLWCSYVAPWRGPRLVLQGTTAGWSKQDLDGQEEAMKAGVPVGPEPDGLWWDESGSRPHPSLAGDWGAFYRQVRVAVETGGPLPVDPADSVGVLAVLEAARRSQETGTVVRLA
jgi:predicted dehydrogenase